MATHMEMVSMSICKRHCASKLMPGVFFKRNTVRVHQLETLLRRELTSTTQP